MKAESMTDLETVVRAVACSRKYRAVCPDTVARLGAMELAIHGDPGVAIKETKGKLHQIYAAFEGRIDYGRAYHQLEAAYTTRRESQIKSACMELMKLHTSTRERLPILDDFFEDIFRLTGRPKTLLDLGCGLCPLAVSWMDLPRGARYYAYDIDLNRIRLLNHYFHLAGLPQLAFCHDILSRPPGIGADVAFLLKTSPCLEHQEKSGTLRLLDALLTQYVVVSFAVKSLGGREKGMLAHYEHSFLALVHGRNWAVTKVVFDTELVFIVKK